MTCHNKKGEIEIWQNAYKHNLYKHNLLQVYKWQLQQNETDKSWHLTVCDSIRKSNMLFYLYVCTYVCMYVCISWL